MLNPSKTSTLLKLRCKAHSSLTHGLTCSVTAVLWLIFHSPAWSQDAATGQPSTTSVAAASGVPGAGDAGTAAMPRLPGERLVVPGDSLALTVDEQPSLNKTYGVSGDGTISLGEFGRIQVSGRPIPAAQAVVREYLEERFFRRATVALSFSDSIDGSVYVVGGPRSSSELAFKSDELLSLFEAITKTGGLGTRSNGREVKILRWQPGQGLRREIITVDVQRMYDTLDFSGDEYLRPRDIVLIPSAQTGDGTSEVLLLGQVASVGYHQWSPGLNVLRLLARTGWLGSSPDPESARILRVNESGGYDPIPVNLNMIASGQDMSQNIPLQPGDILFVPTAGQATAGNVFFWGQVSRSGPYPLPLRGDLMLSAAVLAVGPSQFAKLDQVQVTRKGPGGVRHTIPVNVQRILERGLFEEDFPLQDGDYIKIPEKVFIP